MEDRKMQIIQELMDQLSSEMEYGKEDFSSRLGRDKPDMSIVKVEAEPMEGDMDDMGPMADEGEMSMMDEEPSPDMDLKKRLMKLRG